MAMDFTRLAKAAMGRVDTPEPRWLPSSGGGLDRRKPAPTTTPGINPGQPTPSLPPPVHEGKAKAGEAPNWLAEGLGKMAEIKTESDAPPAPVINFTPQAPVQAQYQAQPVMQTPFAPPQPDPMAQKKMFEDMLRGWIGIRG